MDHNELLTPAEFGRRIGRSRAYVYRLINEKRIRCVTIPASTKRADGKPGRGATRITTTALNDFLASLDGAGKGKDVA